MRRAESPEEQTTAGIPRIQENEMVKASVDKLKRHLPMRLAMVRGNRSQRQFARDLGVFQQNINRYEAGTTPHTDFLVTLGMKEGVSIDWLLFGKGKAKHRNGRSRNGHGHGRKR